MTPSPGSGDPGYRFTTSGCGEMTKNRQLQYGFLEAGPKSTAVLIDAALSTGNPETLYMFNLARGKILEYNRALVEPKLQELDSGDRKLIEQLEAGFETALASFEPRVRLKASLAETPRAAMSDRALPAESFDEEAVAEDEELDELIGAGGEDMIDDEDEDWDEDDD
jgi:hypothetical protein